MYHNYIFHLRLLNQFKSSPPPPPPSRPPPRLLPLQHCHHQHITTSTPAAAALHTINSRIVLCCTIIQTSEMNEEGIGKGLVFDFTTATHCSLNEALCKVLLSMISVFLCGSLFLCTCSCLVVFGILHISLCL